MTTMTANKPINVEAQRVVKIVEETQAALETLSFLSAEMFQEVFKKNEEELKNVFGNEAGEYLADEAVREDNFQSANCFDGVHMEDLNSEAITPEFRRGARVNANAIEKNIKQLVRIFARRDMRDKLVKEFGPFKNNEISGFKGSYERMKMLYQVKNGTSLEEYTTTMEQLKEMKSTTETLKQTLNNKQDTLDQYMQESKEHKAQRSKEIEDLKKQRQELGTEKRGKEKELMEQGELIKQDAAERNKKRVTDLKARIAALNDELKGAKLSHAAEEK